jgi:hypothetical protein
LYVRYDRVSSAVWREEGDEKRERERGRAEEEGEVPEQTVPMRSKEMGSHII